MASRAYGEISAQCFERYGRWGAIYDHPRCLELWGLLSKLICHQGSTMTALSVVPLTSLVHGSVSEKSVRELMAILQEHDLVRWDERFNLVYLPKTIEDQMGLTTGRIKPRDNRLRSVRNQLLTLERLIGPHEFISDLRSKYLPEEEPVENGRGLGKPLADSADSANSLTTTENSSAKGLSEGACQSPTASAPAPAPAPDLELQGEGGAGGEGDRRPVTRSEQGMVIPGSQFKPGPGAVDWARDDLRLSDSEIDRTTDEYQRKNWVVSKYERQHLLGWKAFAHNLADRKASRQAAERAIGGPHERPQGDNGAGASWGADTGRAGTEPPASRAADSSSAAAGDQPRRLSEIDAAHRRRSQKFFDTLSDADPRAAKGP